MDLNIEEFLEEKFPYFEKELVDEIVAVSSLQKLPAHSKLMEPGKHVAHFPMLCSGLIHVYRDDPEGREVLLYYLKPGEACSAMLSCCMTSLKSEIHAKVLEDSVIIKIPVTHIETWLTKYSSWKNFIFYSYKQRYNELLDTIDSLAFLKMDERLVRFFENIYNTTGKVQFEGSHFEIAQSLNSSREVISRLLKTLEKNGKVELFRNKVDFSKLVS